MTAVSPPPADDQAVRTWERRDIALLSEHLGLPPDEERDGGDIADAIVALRLRAEVLSGLLRGMARRVGAERQVSAKIAQAADRHVAQLREENERLRAAMVTADTWKARHDHAIHVRDVAIGQVGQVRAERATLWKILGRPDGNGMSVELCDAVADERDARRRFQKDAAERDAQVAAVRALADGMFDEVRHLRASNAAGRAEAAVINATANRILVALDGPTEAPAMRYELSCILCSPSPHFHLAPFESNAERQAWVDAHQAATGHEDFRFTNTPVSSGPAEAAEPAQPEWAILNPPTGMMADLRDELRIEQEIVAEAGAPEPEPHPWEAEAALSGEWAEVERDAQKWRARAPEPAPAPGYPRIADAITAACEAADIDLTVVHDGRVLDYVPGVVWLATVLDKAGLIDWAAFQDEADSVTTAPDPDELTAAIAAADINWSRTLGDPPADPAYIESLARYVCRRWHLVVGSNPFAAVPTALIGTYADPEFVAHQDHKHPVEHCVYCPSEEDR